MKIIAKVQKNNVLAGDVLEVQTQASTEELGNFIIIKKDIFTILLREYEYIPYDIQSSVDLSAIKVRPVNVDSKLHPSAYIADCDRALSDLEKAAHIERLLLRLQVVRTGISLATLYADKTTMSSGHIFRVLNIHGLSLIDAIFRSDKVVVCSHIFWSM